MLNGTPADVPQPESKSQAPTLERGSYPVICNLMIDLGIQERPNFDDKNKIDQKHQIWLGFTFPTEVYEVELEDGTKIQRELSKGKSYNVSTFSKAALQEIYDTFLNKGDAYSKLLGMPMLLEYGPNSNGNLTIKGLTNLPKGMEVGKSITKPILITEDDWDKIDEYDLPPFMKDMVKNRVQG